MANERAIVFCQWNTVLNEEDFSEPLIEYHPRIEEDYPRTRPDGGCSGYQNLTTQGIDQMIPDPNSFYAYVWGTTEFMDAVDADPNYTIQPGSRVNLDELEPPPDPEGEMERAFVAANENPNDVPTQPEWVQYRNSITEMRDPDTNRKIWNTGQLNQAIGPTVNGRTWAELSADMKEYMDSVTQGAAAGIMVPEDFPAGDITGYSTQENIGALDVDDPMGVPVARFVSHPAFGGTIAFDIDLGLPVGPDAFTSLEIEGGAGLLTADAWYVAATQTWVWFNTGYEFTPGDPVVLVLSL